MDSSLPKCKHCGKEIRKASTTTGWMHLSQADFRSCGSHADAEEITEPEIMSDPKGFDGVQHNFIGSIVHHRVIIEDNRRAIREANKTVATAEVVWKEAQRVHIMKLRSCAEQAKFHQRELEIVEGKLRKSILEDTLVKGIPEPETPETEPELEEIEQEVELGRAE